MEKMNERMVFCSHHKREMPGLSCAPIKGPLGDVVYNNVSAEAWDEWREREIKIINEERLDLSDEKAQVRLFEQMVEFLGLGDILPKE